MSDLLDRLRALRGPSEARSVDARDDQGAISMSTVLGGRPVDGPAGGYVERIDRTVLPARHGAAPLHAGAVHPWTWAWCQPRDRRWRPSDLMRLPMPPTAERVAYVDTETTGLSGGAGTYAFLVGVGRYVGNVFEVVQALLPGPEHERSQLLAVADTLRGVELVVTYNGASFDVPLLRTRYAFHGLDDPFARLAHLDLLPLARRWWRDVLPDRRLGTVEREILGMRRTAADVPGAEVPARYVAYLRNGDATPLVGVVRHNVDDVVALAALRSRLEAPFGGAPGPVEAEHPVPHVPRRTTDVVPLASYEHHGIGRWLEGWGDPGRALRYYLAAEPWLDEARWDAARLLRRLGAVDRAVERWRSMAEAGDARAWLELAKWFEHRQHDHAAALDAVEQARRLGPPRDADMDRRTARLASKLASPKGRRRGDRRG